MATAKKLPSGSWRCQVFSHYEIVLDKNGKPVIDPKTKKQKQKRIFSRLLPGSQKRATATPTLPA